MRFSRHPLVAAKNVGNATVTGEPGETEVPVKAWPLRILVTGFGSFPGTRHNPTAQLIHALVNHKARLARLGIALDVALLPVHFAGAAQKLEGLERTLHPDAILHFGLAARRKYLSVETRALNRVNLLHSDTSGACASCRVIVASAAHSKRATFPARQIEAALRRAGIDARLSVNAGDYVCNEILYLSLSRSQARAVGFLHVPRLARLDRPKKMPQDRCAHLAGLTRAALIAILVTARNLRRGLTPRGS
jgi:pyroglutamyl-peptidase